MSKQDFNMSMPEFVKAHSKLTTFGVEFNNWSLEQLTKERDRLNSPSLVNPTQLIAANHHAGGVARLEKLQLIVGFMEHNKLSAWEPEKKDDDSYTRSIKERMEAEDRRLTSMPKALADALDKHTNACGNIDFQAQLLEVAVAECEQSEAELKEAAYAAGVGSKDLRLQLDAATVRDMIRRRFADGRGRERQGVMASARTAIHQMITSRFKRTIAA